MCDRKNTLFCFLRKGLCTPTFLWGWFLVLQQRLHIPFTGPHNGLPVHATWSHVADKPLLYTSGEVRVFGIQTAYNSCLDPIASRNCVCAVTYLKLESGRTSNNRE